MHPNYSLVMVSLSHPVLWVIVSWSKHANWIKKDPDNLENNGDQEELIGNGTGPPHDEGLRGARDQSCQQNCNNPLQFNYFDSPDTNIR